MHSLLLSSYQVSIIPLPKYKKIVGTSTLEYEYPPANFYFQIEGLKPRTLRVDLTRVGVDDERRLQRDDVHDRRLNVLFEAQSVRYNLSRVKNS
ncbi:hypothetical protein EVAR_17304_1 [Eumeta japonica]|uniref:Uncharacterized protein n=1 Tax=Eumeta variegata TaxID=151549 RepID=A0A4C1TT54_EUMVA|nr:hypothetical protein EVAR_17304_1 [Eumeta japonica]